MGRGEVAVQEKERMERQRVRGPAFQTETVSHACLLIVALLCLPW
jgi:hypothetical protein